jgi:hypothetical protein
MGLYRRSKRRGATEVLRGHQFLAKAWNAEQPVGSSWTRRLLPATTWSPTSATRPRWRPPMSGYQWSRANLPMPLQSRAAMQGVDAVITSLTPTMFGAPPGET